MQVQFDFTGVPKPTGGGLIWEHFDPAVPQLDHAYCRMPWPTVPHYHERMTECYHFMYGPAKLVVGGVVTIVDRGHIERIPPMTAHYVIPRPGLQKPRSLELFMYNAPAFGSFDPPDFVVLDNGDNPDVGFNFPHFLFDLRDEVARRNRRLYRSAGELAGINWRDLVAMLCLPEYRSFYRQAFSAVGPGSDN